MPLTASSTDNGEFFAQFADTIGDESGTRDAIGNYVAATDFKLVPAARTVVHIHRLIVQIEVSGNTAADIYGDQPQLVNGIRVLRLDSDDNVLREYTNSETIKDNAGWDRYCHDVNYVTFPGAGNNFVSVRWTFNRGGAPIKLTNGDYFALRLNDDFTGLVAHFFNLQGVLFA